jgi:hypothetical protein
VFFFARSRTVPRRGPPPPRCIPRAACGGRGGRVCRRLRRDYTFRLSEPVGPGRPRSPAGITGNTWPRRRGVKTAGRAGAAILGDLAPRRRGVEPDESRERESHLRTQAHGARARGTRAQRRTTRAPALRPPPHPT